MPRPTSKAQLLDYAQTNYEKLQAELANFSPEQQCQGGIVGEWSMKDVLAHLMAWGQMCQNWYEMGKSGETPITPHEDFTWKEIPALNQHIYETYQDHDLDDIRSQFENTHAALMALIEHTSDNELFTPKVYAWTKTTTLGSYLTSATSSHYDWARKEIRKGWKKHIAK